ncbi:bifunctional glyoxylate/hydroxypyruvate reductase B [Pollutimonas nitritireducens]|uniref:Glyoxylate/hydroxypyruvate reductase B n=1 Tax=Pollutimonas nitritireducens TaxID=2045209 RepID=A0A2N4UJK9_9BURK|nr:D-glycerate dehydrogenase [Pollutimonas nitritireducens]PLC55212.1 bifunctional glyoxylate/hydroxypyruvate reductase B [Pollutimonas nitritireducens]
MSRRKVLVYRQLPPDQLARIEQAHDVVVANPRVDGQRDAFLNALPTVEGMIGSSYPIDEEVLKQAPRLKVISSISVGLDKFSLHAVGRRGIMLCHTPGVLTETVADLLFAMVLATSRRVAELARYVRDGRWDRSVGEDLYGWDVHGKTMGIVGYGRIGQALAHRAALGFNMPVLYHTRTPVPSGLPEGRALAVTLRDVLMGSDFLVLVLPLTEQTRGLIGPQEFALMKPGAILINGARGPIVQEAALLHALQHGPLRAAGLDVFDTEPLPVDSPLRTHPKVLALPHVGSATHETRQAMCEMATTNLLLALQGKPPLAAYAPVPSM